MTATPRQDLEREAIEAAERWYPPGAGRLGGKLYAGKPAKEGFRERSSFQHGYIAAATARDKENEELRARATQLESDFDGVRENLSAEVAGLKVTVLKLEAQVDDYEEKMSRVPAGFFA